MSLLSRNNTIPRSRQQRHCDGGCYRKNTTRRKTSTMSRILFVPCSIFSCTVLLTLLMRLPSAVSFLAPPFFSVHSRTAFVGEKLHPFAVSNACLKSSHSDHDLVDLANADEYDFDDDIDDDDDADQLEPVALPEVMDDDDVLNRQDLEALTVSQLKQQLRLRGLKVSGRKQQLIDRLVPTSAAASDGPFNLQSSHNDNEEGITSKESAFSKAKKIAEEHGKEFVDVSEYLDEEDKGKEVKTWKKGIVDADFKKNEDYDDNDTTESSATSSGGKPEVWGSEARIVDDYEGRKVVVDCLSQTVIEFKGSNQSYASAFVVASKDSLKPFLAGGTMGSKNGTSAEERLRDIQMRREQAHKIPVRFEDEKGLDDGDEDGLYDTPIERDFSDWGKYTLTGAQLSAAEVQGVLFLSDVYGAFSPDTQTLAEKIAFECQPVVVMVPDLFRGNPWKEQENGRNEKGQTYEEWRATHSELRVSVDIRAAAACLREKYGVSSVVVWGTCFGGGRALEAAAGYLPDDNIHDVDGRIGPPFVNPMAAVAWYPTRYDASALFGKDRAVDTIYKERREFAVMGVFAGNDEIPGATQEDASKLKALLSEDDRVKDHLIKIFPEQDHGFAHIGLAAKASMDRDTAFERFVDDEFGGAGQVSLDDGEAEVACLLSTAFMETYSRLFLPTQGVPIIKDSDKWSSELEMKGLSEANTRDIRREIEDSLQNFKEEPLEGYFIDPWDESQQKELAELLRKMQSENVPTSLKIADDDDIQTIYAKLRASDEHFELF